MLTAPIIHGDIRASVGLALYPEHGSDAQTLVQRAGQALYLVKAKGNGAALYKAD